MVDPESLISLAALAKLDRTANLAEDTYQNGKSNFSSEAKLQWAGSRENISPPAVARVFSSRPF
jgi:hypothetical protein